MALTGKKRAFADAVLAGSSNKEAAIAAGYSAATASASGSRLVKDLGVVAYLATRRAEKPVPAKAGKAPPPPDPDADGADYEYTDDPEKFLTAVMNDPLMEMRMRAGVARALMPYKHQKLGEGGKKDQKDADAKKVAKGKFAPGAPPLRAVK